MDSKHNQPTPYTYAGAGVSIETGNALVRAIAPLARATRRPGADADLGTLQRIAEATNAAAYDASDPASIDRVFTSVISNF